VRHRWMMVLLAVSLTDIAACAGRSPSTAASPLQPTLVTVRNDNWLDAVVYAMRGASRVRLGTVAGLSTATLKAPSNYAPDGTFQLLVDPIGSNTVYMTDGFVVSPGQRVELSIAPSLRMSSVAVWWR
jgi:hypothetical protein